MNAFKTAIGGLGKAADAVLLGGTLGQNQRRNAFADMIQQGDYQSAADFATRHGRDDLAQMAAQRGQAQQQGQQKADEDADKFLGLAVDAVLMAHPTKRAETFALFKSLAEARGLTEYYDPREVMSFEQNLGNDAYLQGVRAQLGGLDQKTVIDQRFEDRKITETGRSNMAGERLRGGELGVAQGNLALNHQRFNEDARQFDATHGLDQRKFNEDQRQFNQAQAAKQAPEIDDGSQKVANTWVAARNALIDALGKTTTGPVIGSFMATTSEAQTADGAVAALAPVLKQIFRVAGEGVFTDKDQQLLLDMVPDRNDHRKARLAKIENIDRIISAKLGVEIPSYGAEAPKAPVRGRVDLSQYSDADLEAIANGGQ